MEINKENIFFDYPDFVNPDRDKEGVMSMNLNMWLSSFAERINKEGVKIRIYFGEDNIRHVSFETLNEDLKGELMAHMKRYVTPY